MRPNGELAFAGTQRFEIRRRLGTGGMGVVYEAFDRERRTRVALKTLRNVDAPALTRFKREFRALHDLEHPNLISLGELFADAGDWFFTMELIEGVEFLAHVQAGKPAVAREVAQGKAITRRVHLESADTALGPEIGAHDFDPPDFDPPGRLSSHIFDEPRLRSALKQLAQAIAALHQTDTLHRDIKPSNILVTDAGRVVVLDFGLVTSMRSDRQSSTASVVGTAEYMAPEQALAVDVGPAADWYALGVILYEALTGQLPYSGSSAIELLMKKQKRAALPPRQLVSDIPEDLSRLCIELLQVDPSQRPAGHEILDSLGAQVPVSLSSSSFSPLSSSSSSSFSSSSSSSSSSPQAMASQAQATQDMATRATQDMASHAAQALTSQAQATQATPFVGRESELAQLRKAYEDSRGGAPVSLFVHGPSGLGKSELVHHFADSLVREDPRVVVLSGRCYERESVPYKAFDGIADSLCQYMMRLPDIVALQLLPRRAALLPHLFPALQRVKVIAAAQKQSQVLLDPQERRTRMFHAFRDLLARLADRGPVVLVIDDFQWAGADSLTMLGEVMPSSEAPELLLLGTARPGVEELLNRHSSGDVRNLHLGELSPEVSLELVRRFAPRLDDKQARAIADDSAGHPLFILELVRHLSQGGAGGAMRLDDALWSRISGLRRDPRHLVELLAVAGSPIAQETAAAAAGLSFGDYEKAVRILRIGSLARTMSRGADTVEPYHDRVREAVLARLDADVRKAHHRELAVALEAAGAATTDPQVLVRHFAASGESTIAAEHAEAAAMRASATSAFDQAAELLGTVLELGVHGEDKSRSLRLLLGEFLIGAGRGLEAAEVFLEAAKGADSATRLECRRRASEQLLISGHLEQGLDAMRSLLAEIGVRMPATPRGALFSLLWQRARVRLRGLGWKEKDVSQIPAETLTRLDVYTSASHGLGVTDVIRGMDFQCRGLLLALRTGERARVARAMFYESLLHSTSGPRSVARARALLEEARQIALPLDDPYLQVWQIGGEGFIHYFNGRYRPAVIKLSAAERAFREQDGVAWELSSVRMLWMWSLHRLGALDEMAPLLREYLRDAERRGDLYAQTSLIRSCHRGLLVSGTIEDARSELSRTRWLSTEGHFHLQHWFEFYARAEIALYAGDSHEMDDEVKQSARDLKRSMLLRVQTVRADFRWLRGRLLLASCGRGGSKAKTLRQVQRIARQLERERVDDARVMALLLRAAVAAQRQDSGRAHATLHTVIELATKSDMILHAGVAERRLGELLGGEEGEVLVARGAERMKNQGAKDVVPMSEMIAPGFASPVPPPALLKPAGSSSSSEVSGSSETPEDPSHS